MALLQRRRPTSGCGLTSLMVACQQGLDADVQNIIRRKPGSISLKDRTGKNALHYCAENTHTACAEQILEKNKDLLDAQDDEGYSVLHLAVISGNVLMVRFLIDTGADVACVDNEKHTCIHWATVCGELECLDLLRETGADLSTPDIHGAYPVHYAAQMCGPNSEMGNNVKLGLMVLQNLLSKGVDVNCQDQDGRQPLLWAASAGSSDAILTLIKAGADVSARDKDGLTALHCAASRGHLDCLETLINLCGAQVDALDSNKCSPLFYAVTLGHADCTHLLLSYRAKASLQDNKGRSAAHCGASKGQLETLRILGQGGANLWLRNSKGDTPLHEAVQSGRKELVEWFLEQLEGSVNVTNVNGRTPLHISAITNNVELCKVLMDHGAFINPIMKNSKGHLLTPLDAALHRGNRGCAKYLQLHGALPATKLVEKTDVYRSEVSPDQSVASSESRHRIFKESAVQTENVRKDADVQVQSKHRLSRDVTRDESEVDKAFDSLSRERALKDSRKPIVAKVYVHTKRRDRKPIRRLIDETRRRSQQIQLPDSKYQKRPSRRLPNSTTSMKSTTASKDATDATLPDLSEKTFTGVVNQNGGALVKEELATGKVDGQDIMVHPEPSPVKGICGCCADPYEDESSLTSSCSCGCHKRNLQSGKAIEISDKDDEVVDDEKGEDEAEQNQESDQHPEIKIESEAEAEIEPEGKTEQELEIEPEADIVPADEIEQDEEKEQEGELEPVVEPEHETEELESETKNELEIDAEDDGAENGNSKEGSDAEENENALDVDAGEAENEVMNLEEEDGDGEKEKEDEADEELRNHETVDITLEYAQRDSSEEYHHGLAEYRRISEEHAGEVVIERPPKDYLPLDFDDHSPLSSLRSIESNIKDSGFSDDFDRGEASSETDDHMTSPKHRSKKKPIARFVVSSGAADSPYPLEEEEEDMALQRFALRSASLPSIHAKLPKHDCCPKSLGRLALTKEVQKTLRRYQLERRLFYELQDLKRKQICGTTQDEEAIAVDKMVERFRRYVLSAGMTDFRGPLTFYAFEKYLYEQLRKLSMNCKLPKPKPGFSFPARVPNTPENRHGLCVCKTHMCHHIRRPPGSTSLYKSDDKESVRQIVLPVIQPEKRRSTSRIPTSRSKSYDRSRAGYRPDAQMKRSSSRYDISKSLPALNVRIPKHIPESLLSAICQRLGPDVHLDDTVVIELSSGDDGPKVRHAFTVREIREAVRQWEETSGRRLKPIHLEKVIDSDDGGPVTFEIRHGNERNVFRLPAEKLQGSRKWQVTFTIGKGLKKIPVLSE